MTQHVIKYVVRSSPAAVHLHLKVALGSFAQASVVVELAWAAVAVAAAAAAENQQCIRQQTILKKSGFPHMQVQQMLNMKLGLMAEQDT